MYKYFTNATTIASTIINNKVKNGDIVIDATIGNGKDTVLLARLVGDNGKVYGFDIQKIAIDLTQNALQENNLLRRVILINDSHENIDNYISKKVDLVVFNLGYLPKGNHNIVTKSTTTIIALSKSIDLLNNKGLILITTYPGHAEGKKENEEIAIFLSKLNQKEFSVLKFEFMNQINNPPILYGIEKK